ncbi:hypothetical protein M3Y99_00153200 [Aphelenchoides fujianensis]|nr:hypothetical protein M3Y99_00153200 [Aphelenchoides fujianensis]
MMDGFGRPSFLMPPVFDDSDEDAAETFAERIHELQAEVADEKCKAASAREDTAVLESVLIALEAECARLERAGVDAEHKLEDELRLKDDEISELKESAHESAKEASKLREELAVVRQEQEKEEWAARIAQLTAALEQQKAVGEAAVAEKADVLKEVWKWMNHEPADDEAGGQQPPHLDDDSQLPPALQAADDRSDSSSSSEWEPVDAE